MKKIFISVLVSAIFLTASACGIHKDATLESSPSSTIAVGTTVAEVKKVVKPTEELKIISSDAKHAAYNSVQELESKADLIVQANFTGERNINEYKGAQGEVS